jgi:hypothetical protein
MKDRLSASFAIGARGCKEEGRGKRSLQTELELEIRKVKRPVPLGTLTPWFIEVVPEPEGASCARAS